MQLLPQSLATVPRQGRNPVQLGRQCRARGHDFGVRGFAGLTPTTASSSFQTATAAPQRKTRHPCGWRALAFALTGGGQLAEASCLGSLNVQTMPPWFR